MNGLRKVGSNTYEYTISDEDGGAEHQDHQPSQFVVEKTSLWTLVPFTIGIPIFTSYVTGALPVDISEWRTREFRTIVASVVLDLGGGLLLREWTAEIVEEG